jgi:hypothetical protein
MTGRRASVDALQGALRAEHAAVYGYGVVGARLRGALQRRARTLWNAHRAQRNALAARITALGAEPEAAAAAYTLPARVTSTRSAAQVAATLEDDLVTAYAGLAGSADAALRTLAARAMQEAVTQVVRWQAEAGRPNSHPSAFPGLPSGALAPGPSEED